MKVAQDLASDMFEKLAQGNLVEIFIKSKVLISTLELPSINWTSAMTHWYDKLKKQIMVKMVWLGPWIYKTCKQYEIMDGSYV